MNDSRDIQQLFFTAVRQTLAPGVLLQEYVAEHLDISKDSAYRRIRGEKELSFDEMMALCTVAGLSLDEIIGMSEGKVLFSGRFIEEGQFSFQDFLKSLLSQVAVIADTPGTHLIYQNKDISFFYYLMFPDLLAFKYYIWMSQHFGFQDLSKGLFQFSCLSDADLALAREISSRFIQIPSTEIMNPDNVLTDLRQVEYFKATGKFSSVEDMNRVYDALEALVSHQEYQAQSGRKFLAGHHPDASSKEITVYVHDFHYGDNEAIVLMNGNIMTVLTHTSINIMQTFDETMGAYSYEFLQNMIRKSTLISGVGEKFRTRFFNTIRDTIARFRRDEVVSLLP